MQSLIDPNLTSNTGLLRETIASAHARAGAARGLAAAILETAVRLYSANGEVRGWLWRYA
jgi:hypothetical protein